MYSFHAHITTETSNYKYEINIVSRGSHLASHFGNGSGSLFKVLILPFPKLKIDRIILVTLYLHWYPFQLDHIFDQSTIKLLLAALYLLLN